MNDMSNPLRWASELISSLQHHGVSQAVISPGSRSSPLAIAAAIHPGIQKKIVLDERSAAFIALGIGKATGKPALLICTSGTAAANYFPAVIEAKESGVPMIILSADRPPNLRNLGSSQTIDQIKLFGDQAVFFHDTGEPVISDTDLKRLSYLGRQAVAVSIQKGGAAHINLPFRKPLEPTSQQLSEEMERIKKHGLRKARTVSRSTNTVRFDDQIQSLILSSEKPLIIAGPANPHHLLSRQLEVLSSRLNAPVIAEPGSSLTAKEYLLHRYEQFLRNNGNLNLLKPDLIIRFGDQPFTKSLLLVLEEWKDVPVIHISSRNSWQDHAMSIDSTIECSPQDELDLESVPIRNHSEWNDAWMEAEQASQHKLDTHLKKKKVLTDGHVFQKLAHILTEDWQVMLSNSFPARDMALFGKMSSHQFVNRGAAGIDGITSTAIGLHLMNQKPTCCITGDLAFLHDANALYSIRKLQSPFLVVVINNGGGTIFRMLPVYRENISPELFETYFETPQNVEIRKLAEASGLSYQKIETLDQLESFDIGSFSTPAVIECRTDADASMYLRENLWNR